MANDELLDGNRSAAEVDRIRDIIFGPQMRRYEQQFQRIASQLDGLGKQLDELQSALDEQGSDQEARLRKAQKEPDKYRDLIVRVAGYSDYFVDLGPDLQNEIIERTEHMELS